MGEDRVTFQIQFAQDNVATVYYENVPEDLELVLAYQNASKDQGGTIVGGKPLPGVPYAIELSAELPVVESLFSEVSLAAGSSVAIDFTVIPGVLQLGPNSVNIPLRTDLGPDSDQRVHLILEYETSPAADYFGEGILRFSGDWIEYKTMGWLATSYWPYVYSLQLGWLYKAGNEDTHFLYAFGWDSGWLYLFPDFYPCSYFDGSDSIPAGWGYLYPNETTIDVQIIGGNYISIPRQ